MVWTFISAAAASYCSKARDREGLAEVPPNFCTFVIVRVAEKM